MATHTTIAVPTITISAISNHSSFPTFFPRRLGPAMQAFPGSTPGPRRDENGSIGSSFFEPWNTTHPILKPRHGSESALRISVAGNQYYSIAIDS